MATAAALDIHNMPINQRTVSAAGLKPPATTAAASVFGIAGQAVKPRRYKLPLLLLDDLVISDNVPLPPRARGANPGVSPYFALLAKLKPGQSVVLSEGHSKTLASSARKAKVPFALRKLGDGRVGFWRLAD